MSGSSTQPDTAGWDDTGCVRRTNCEAQLSRLDLRPLPLWTRGSCTEGLRGPAGEGGSGLRRSLRRPSLGFTPPQGWEPGHILSHGTKQRERVCVRWGFKGGGPMGSRP